MTEHLERREKLVVAMAIVMAATNLALVIGVVGAFHGSPLAEIADDARLASYNDPLFDLPVCVVVHDWMLPWNCMDLQCACVDENPSDSCTCP